MGRLVKKVDLPVYGEMYIACVDDVSIETMQALQEPLKKLYEYEQEEEQGKLAHLPCKLGDVSYWVNEKCGGEKEIKSGNPIIAIVIAEDGIYISTECEYTSDDWNISENYKIGSQYALLSREDAERKLKEMEEDND